MSKERIDPEIAKIQEGVIRAWVSNGSALICARCGRAYVPSRSSDDRLCGCCVPLRNLEVGDKSPQHAKCDYCGGDIPSGKRNDSKFCKDSCRVLAHRRRRNGDSRTTRESAVLAKDGGISPPTIPVNESSGKEGFRGLNGFEHPNGVEVASAVKETLYSEHDIIIHEIEGVE